LNYLLLVWLAVSTAACQVLSGASSLSVEDPAPPTTRTDPMREEPGQPERNDAGKPEQPIITDTPDDAGPPMAGMGGEGSAGQSGSSSEPVAGSAAGSGGAPLEDSSPVQPCSSDDECNGRKCLRQG